MVESIEHFPAEFDVPFLREMEILHQRRIQIPETGPPNGIRPGLHISERPRARIEIGIVSPESRIASKSGLKSGGVDPICNLLGFGAMPAEMRVADQVASASKLRAGGAWCA